MNIYLKRGATLLILIGLSTPALATNGYFAHGYGTKNKGLVGGASALPQDAMAAATNPAGMVFVGNRMDFGGAIFSPSPRTYDVTGGPSNACAPPCTFSIGPEDNESENDYFLIPHFARNWMLDTNSSAGITVYGNGGMNTEWKGGSATHFVPPAGPFQTFDGTYGAGTAGVDLSQLFINGSYARKISDTSSYGASLIFAFQRFEAKGLSKFGDFGLSDDPTKLTNNDYDTSTGFGVKLGWQGELTSGLTMAFSYQSEIDMSEFDDYAGLFAEQGDFDIPATWTLGVALNVGPKSKLVMDVQRIYYSDIASVGNPIMPALINCMPAAAGGGGDTTQCLGTDDGPGFGWEDMTIYKLGYQWSTNNKWIWRVGYSYGEQPIPDSEVLFNILAPAVIEEHVTFGFTNIISPTSEFNFAFMYALENSVSGPNPLDPAQEVELEMSQYEFEGSYSIKF